MSGVGSAAARMILRRPLTQVLPGALRSSPRSPVGWMKSRSMQGGVTGRHPGSWRVGALSPAARPITSTAFHLQQTLGRVVGEPVIVPKPVPPYPVSSVKEERRRRERLATEYFDYPVSTLTGEEKGTIKLATAVFKEPLRVDILQRVVLWQQAKKRPMTKAVKTRADVRGGGRKPWPQKGQGRARAGSIRSPLWRGGGKAMAPKARSYEFSIPRKVRRMALRVALSARLREGKLIIVEDLDVAEHKTSLLKSVFDSRGIDNALVIGKELPNNFKMACMNLPNIDALAALGSNVYSILKRRHLIISKSGVEYLHMFLLREPISEPGA